MGIRVDNRPDILPEERTCPVTDDIVDISPARGGRKIEKDIAAYPNSLLSHDEKCDFCSGHEERTPDPEAIRMPEDGDWSKRIVPNLYPIKMIENGRLIVVNSPYFLPFKTSALGVHDVLVETPLHNGCISRLSVGDISLIALAIAWRHDDLALNEDYAFFGAYKNHGKQAGASMEHPHTQLEASKTIPPAIRRVIGNFEKSFRAGKGCLLCDNILEASRKEGLMVSETENFASLVPFAAKGFCETWIIPKFHSSSFSVCVTADEKIRQEYAWLQLDSMLRIKRVIQDKVSETPMFDVLHSDPPYRAFLYTAPYRDEHGCKDHGFFHWWWAIRPQLKGRGAREEFIGEEVEIRFPERAAELLREARVVLPEESLVAV